MKSFTNLILKFQIKKNLFFFIFQNVLERFKTSKQRRPKNTEPPDTPRLQRLRSLEPQLEQNRLQGKLCESTHRR